MTVWEGGGFSGACEFGNSNKSGLCSPACGPSEAVIPGHRRLLSSSIETELSSGT